MLIGRRLDPARHLDLVETPLAAVGVGLLGAVLELLEQLIGVPVLRIVVLDVLSSHPLTRERLRHP